MKNMKKRTRYVYFVVIAMLFAVLCSFDTLAAPEYDCEKEGHKYVEIKRTPATENTDGVVIYICDICDNEGYDIIFATKHVWSAWITDKAASCTQSGERHRTCTRGASHNQYETIPALGHDYKETVTVQAGCETDGIKSVICSRCGDSAEQKIIPAVGHQYEEHLVKEPSCMEDTERVFICKHDPLHMYTEVVPALGHDYGEWFVETPAKEGVTGVEVRVCANDAGHKETRETLAAPRFLSEEISAKKPPFFDTFDIIIVSVDVALLFLFVFLIYPYAKWSVYITRRRKYIKRIKELRKMVAQRYDFK